MGIGVFGVLELLGNDGDLVPTGGYARSVPGLVGAVGAVRIELGACLVLGAIALGGIGQEDDGADGPL